MKTKLRKQAKQMSFVVIGHISSEMDAAQAMAIVKYNQSVANTFAERWFIYNGLKLEGFRKQLVQLGYQPIHLSDNRGYQLGFLDLCSEVNKLVTHPYLQMNNDIAVTPKVLELVIDLESELNYLHSVSCLHKSRSEYGPMGQFFIHIPTKGFAEYNGLDKNICSEYVLRDTCVGGKHCLMDEPMLQSYEAFTKRYKVDDASAKNIELVPIGITHCHCIDHPILQFI